jgi:hypothetical protein
VKNFVPIPFDTASQLNPDLGDISVFIDRLADINSKMIFSAESILLYGYFILFFLAILLTDLVWLRKFNTESRIALCGILVIYIGLPLLGYLFPLVDLVNTTKRGMFKLFPFMLFYLCNSGTLQRISAYLGRMESRTEPPGEQGR